MIGGTLNHLQHMEDHNYEGTTNLSEPCAGAMPGTRKNAATHRHQAQLNPSRFIFSHYGLTRGGGILGREKLLDFGRCLFGEGLVCPHPLPVPTLWCRTT